MAFIRQYMDEAGDPFKLRLPRFLRPPKKVRGFLGKLGKVAGIASTFVPGLGVGSLAARLGGKLGKAGKLAGLIGRGRSAAKRFRMADIYRMVQEQRAAAAAAAAEEPPPGVIDDYDYQEPELTDEDEDDMGFARGYGYYMGDPGTTPKRKAAASGPRAKAAAKRSNRAAKRAGGKPLTGPQKRRPKGGASKGRPAFDITGALQALGGGEGLAAAASAFRPYKQAGAGAMRAAGIRMPSRRMNPANAKALRRSLRRVEGFAKLAKKVQKDAASILRHVDRGPRASSSRGRGHKAGCRCVVCSRAA